MAHSATQDVLFDEDFFEDRPPDPLRNFRRHVERLNNTTLEDYEHAAETLQRRASGMNKMLDHPVLAGFVPFVNHSNMKTNFQLKFHAADAGGIQRYSCVPLYVQVKREEHSQYTDFEYCVEKHLEERNNSARYQDAVMLEELIDGEKCTMFFDIDWSVCVKR